MNDSHDRMYKEHIMELYKSPANYAELENPTHKHTEKNSSSGDEKISDVKFSGSGCVMSIVSSSLLTDKIKGMNVEDAKKLTKDDVLELLKINVNPARLKCITVPLYAVKNSLK